MISECPNCFSKPHGNTPCLLYLNSLSKRLESQVKAQNQILNHYLATSSSLEKVEYPYDMFKNIEHPQACCDSCYQLPLTGTRYKCKKCPNFDLCFRCRHIKNHDHGSFWPITTSKFHLNKQCFACFGKIMDVVHKCIECGRDICHECLIVNGHQHDQIISFLPFDAIVEWNANKHLNKLKKDDEVVIKFVIFNSSLQEIKKIVVRDDGCPFVVVRKEIEVNCKYGCVAIVEVAGIVRGGAGSYNSKFEIVESVCDEIILPPIYIKMAVTEGLFSSFFKS